MTKEASMKVLVATTEGQGDHVGDYCWCVDGELVTPLTLECRDERCGCSRGFPGLASDRATTTAMVVEREQFDEATLAQAVRDALTRGGWLRLLGPVEGNELVNDHLDAISEVCRAFGVGTVLGRSGDLVWDRRTRRARA
jgi:hypothetical protein